MAKKSVKILFNGDGKVEDDSFVYKELTFVPRLDEMVYHRGSHFKVDDIVNDPYYDQITVKTTYEGKAEK